MLKKYIFWTFLEVVLRSTTFRIFFLYYWYITLQTFSQIYKNNNFVLVSDFVVIRKTAFLFIKAKENPTSRALRLGFLIECFAHCKMK
jgi:hypothetical protein